MWELNYLEFSRFIITVKRDYHLTLVYESLLVKYTKNSPALAFFSLPKFQVFIV